MFVCLFPGYIPGHCTSKDVELDNEYIMFLTARSDGIYEQVEVAAPVSRLMEYMGICNLDMQYPRGKYRLDCCAGLLSSEESYSNIMYRVHTRHC